MANAYGPGGWLTKGEAGPSDDAHEMFDVSKITGIRRGKIYMLGDIDEVDNAKEISDSELELKSEEL